MARLLADYLARYDATLVCLQQSAELRDATVLENFNWANWHLNSVLQPALIQLDSLLLESPESLGAQGPAARAYLVQHGRFLAGPGFEPLLRARFAKTEAQQKQVVAEKPNLDAELQLRELFPRLLAAALNYN